IHDHGHNHVDNDSDSLHSCSDIENTTEKSDKDEEDILQDKSIAYEQLLMGLDQGSVSRHGIAITSGGRNSVTVSEVQNHGSIPEYPHTSKKGILHFVYIKSDIPEISGNNMPIRVMIDKYMSNIQFSLADTDSKVTQVALPMLGLKKKDETSKAWRQAFKCQGIRYCEHAHPDVLRTCPAYNRVKLEDINKLREHSTQAVYTLSVNAQLKRRTENWYHGFLQEWSRYSTRCIYADAGTRVCERQEPVFYKYKELYRVGCPLLSNVEPWHTSYTVIPSQARVDLNYLRVLVKYGPQRHARNCTYIGHSISKKSVCGFDHPQGTGKIKKSTCDARLDIYIPTCQDRFPFLMLVARGEHAHHPPYPTKLPKQIAEDVIQAIKQQDLLSLTARRFLVSPGLSNLTSKYGDIALRYIHDSLNVEDRVAALIRKQKLEMFPLGTALAGVEREFGFDKLRPYETRWIRSITFLDESRQKFIIVCCTYAQAKAFLNQACLEMDLAFKMVQGKTNVYSISGWNEDVQRINVYCYAWINVETTNGYHQMFTQMFQTLAEVGRQDIQFPHIDRGENGIRTFTVDMDKKQARGFGEFLHDLDSSREWHEHLEHMLVFCQVHTKRNFKKRFPNHPATHLIAQLWEAETVDELDERMTSIGLLYPKLKTWIKHRQTTWILAGLCQEKSRIPTYWWLLARSHTGIEESSHYQDNEYAGRKLSLLASILRIRGHAQEMFQKNDFDIGRGIASTWRNRSESYRISTQLVKKDKRYRSAATRRRRRPHLPYNPENPHDVTDLDDAEHASGISSASSSETEVFFTPPSRNPPRSGRRGRPRTHAERTSNTNSVISSPTPRGEIGTPISRQRRRSASARRIVTISSDSFSSSSPPSTRATSPSQNQYQASGQHTTIPSSSNITLTRGRRHVATPSEDQIENRARAQRMQRMRQERDKLLQVEEETLQREIEELRYRQRSRSQNLSAAYSVRHRQSVGSAQAGQGPEPAVPENSDDELGAGAAYPVRHTHSMGTAQTGHRPE
ncbi:MAG: hypothetical protein M1835_001264, partial [Candelina submexicana]